MPRRRPKSQRQYVSQNDAVAIAAKFRGAKGVRMPKFIEPCLASLRDRVPSGDQWIHEIKFDGYRLQLHKIENEIRFFTRRGHDWSKRFSSLVQAAWHLPATHLILDGEVIVPTPSGQSDFGALEDDLGTGRSDRFTYFAFDILHINGLSLRDCALADRKTCLLSCCETNWARLASANILRAMGTNSSATHAGSSSKGWYRNGRTQSTGPGGVSIGQSELVVSAKLSSWRASRSTAASLRASTSPAGKTERCTTPAKSSMASTRIARSNSADGLKS